MKNPITRTLVCLVTAAVAASGLGATELPFENPIKQWKADWTDQIPWSDVVCVADFEGDTWDERFAKAQQAVIGKGGGVVFFPAGTYEFNDHLLLADGCVIRGEDPRGEIDARKEKYSLTTKFVFPLYKPSFESDGTPTDTAFKGIRLADPETASNVGVVNVDINRGHVYFAEAAAHKCGSNRLVYGCILRNTATTDASIPDARAEQKPWQRYVQRHHAAIFVYASENLLVANNRLPKSGEANFTMKDYVVAKPVGVLALNFQLGKDKHEIVVIPEVVFDYDNRPGIYANNYPIGAHGDGLPNGTPESHPHGFRKGIEIHGNYIFATGRCPIAFTGDGTKCTHNVIRIPPNIYRPTCRGTELSQAHSSTNDNRAIQCRGWRWDVSYNDFEVHPNVASNYSGPTGDGEGIMHENHENSKVLDSKMIGNRGNQYLCLWRVDIDGLEMRDNFISATGKHWPHRSIYVLGKKKNIQADVSIKRVQIVGNVLAAGGSIAILGDDCEGNVIRGNRRAQGKIINMGNAIVEDNEGYEILTEE